VQPLTDFRSTIRWAGARPEFACAGDYHGSWRAFHREPIEVRLTATNLSSQAWPARALRAPLAISVGYILTEEGGAVREGRLRLPHDIPPGGSADVVLPLCLKPGQYILKASVMQEHRRWFDLDDPQAAGRYEFRVVP
jgi:hypothetical protein